MAGQATFSFYRNPDMEGYLDKYSTGIASKLKAGKTKFWCELQSTMLRLYKENKNLSAANQEIDLKKVHMVRKVSGDKVGNQLEMTCKSKVILFAAPCREDCDTWIKCLRQAMTLKDQQGDDDTQTIRKVSLGDYETVKSLPESTRTQKSKSSVSDSGYAEVEFSTSLKPDDTKTTQSEVAAAMDEENPYSLVEVRTNTASADGHGSSSVNELRKNFERNNSGSNVKLEKKCAEIERDSLGYTKVIPKQPESRAKDVSDGGYAEVTPYLKELKVKDDSEDSSDESDDYVNLLFDSSLSTSIPALPHPLSNCDTQPIKDLQEFLTENKRVCRRSFISGFVCDDPVSGLKSILQELSF